MDASTAELRRLPKIDALLERPEVAGLIDREGRPLVLQAVREAVEEARRAVQAGASCPAAEAILSRALQLVAEAARPTLRRVINASGVVLHTNLGRAPLSAEALAAMAEAGRGYCNLELDLDRGERGSRYAHCGALLARLAGAEDGLVVNNNAAAVTLALAAFARGREAIVSRGQLVEIGGGFRIPDVLRESGATLVEVGTTNRTYIQDYERAVAGERTAALLVVHRSNFQLVGFTHDATLEELSALARRTGALLIDDLGSGTLLDTVPFGLAHEPTVQERAALADIVCFSGDKLLGGPQAGFIVGRKALVERLKAFPLLRALRVDKVTLAGVEATLRHYQRSEALSKIPIWRAISMSVEETEVRAIAWRQALGLPGASLVDSRSAVGGGSLPGMSLPTRALAVAVRAPDEVARELRRGEPAVLARIEGDRLLLDPRTVLPDEDGALVGALRGALKG